MPVSQDDRIMVKVSRSVPECEPDERGMMKWIFQMKPDEKKEIELEFTVDYPKGMIIGGLE